MFSSAIHSCRSALRIAVVSLFLIQPALGATRAPATPTPHNLATTHGRLYAVFRHLNEARWVSVGHGPRVMYVFFDPNCPYCHYLYSVSQQFVRSGQIEVRWIPLGLLTPSSEGKAAAILEAKNGPEALAKNEDRYHRPGGGGIRKILPTQSVRNQLRKNLALFHQVGAGVVPLLVWEDDAGHIRDQVGAVDRQTFAYLIRHVRPAGPEHP